MRSLAATLMILALAARPGVSGAAAVSIDGAARTAIDALPAPAAGAMFAADQSGVESAGETREHVSPYKAFGLSFLLPGLGQRYTGHDGRALGYFIGEGGLWASFVALKIQQRMREDDFAQWAETFAEAKIDGYNRNEAYYQTISKYLSSDDYNLDVRYVARLIYPTDRPAQFAYIEANSIDGDETWSWRSADIRDQYRIIRHGALVADRHANWTLGGLVLLRVVSAIDAALGARHLNRSLAGGDLSLRPALPSGEPGLAVGYERAF